MYESSALQPGSAGSHLKLALGICSALQLDRTTKDGSPRPTPQLEIEGETDAAAVKVPDILVGTSVVHVINDVLLPLSVCSTCR